MKQWWRFLLPVGICLGDFAAAAETDIPLRIAKFQEDRAAAISYTFDDGLRPQLTIAKPMLEKEGFRGTFFIIAGLVAATPEEAISKKPGDWGGVTWDELRTASAAGHEIANHSWSHPGLPELDVTQLDREIVESKRKIRAEIGIAPVTFCYPYNASNDIVRARVMKHHAFAREFQKGIGKNDTSAEGANRWADELIGKGEWGVVMIHGINEGFDALPEETLRDHLAHVKSRGADIWVDTFGNVSRYIRLRDSTSIRILKQEPRRIVFVLDGPETSRELDIPLTLVLTVPGAAKAKVQQEDGTGLPVTVTAEGIRFHCSPGSQKIAIFW